MVESVNPLSNVLSTQASAPTTSLEKATVDYDSFLQLLVTQLENQDPTEPQDNAQLMSQLASFSSVEQQIQTNNKLDQLLSTNSLADASNMLGKTITSADGTVSGKVGSVVLTDSGVQAELENGNRVTISSGVSITE